uniref:Si:dkeyp-68b7.12 n=1 Tax=Xiphophorus maculatus TaxID=8083 RepID=M3ZTV9_XIPMA
MLTMHVPLQEAVAIQLEEERLVKIRDVLKELPDPHYRTLEFLMRHLVKMASYSSETNMHARNLAIVWAPNLLRSKDIEASGFNGTAAFMEVRVQSIVVEFVLTHVPQLFPLEGAPTERRKSLPSPSALPNPDLVFFRSSGSQPNFGNISPGDGPLPIRPYHAIIEGTDKRKGSLKGRKWMSIFNIGGRFPDPRRKHKHSAKEKDRTSLRPARSMDSLSTPSYPNEGSRRSGQHPPSTNLSPAVASLPQPGSDSAAPACGLGSREYAVTYRRGTGLVSGGAGTQGTYTALDPEGLALPGSEGVQTRSPGLSNKARRAAMHITGPTMVTVPLHITSNLALGVLQGGGSDRVIIRGRDKDGGDKQDGKEPGTKIEIKEPKLMEWNVEESKNVEEKDKSENETEDLDTEGRKGAPEVSEEERNEGGEEKKDEELRKDCGHKETGDQHVPREKRVKSCNSSTKEDNHENMGNEDQDSEYMEMKGSDLKIQQAAAASQHEDDSVSDSDEFLNSTEAEEDDRKLSGYIQDNFEFLDQMDCSAMDHMDCSVSYQVNEFSVEPPGHSDDEYEIMAQAERPTLIVTEVNPHRPLSLDLNSRHTKSLSLPYMTSPIDGPEEHSSSDDVSEDEGDEDGYSSDEDESMFVKSLPPDFFLSSLSGLESDHQDCPSPDRQLVQELQRSEGESCEPLDVELSVCKEATEHAQENAGNDEEKQETKMEEEDKSCHGEDQLEKDTHRTTDETPSAAEDDESEKCLTSEASTSCCEELQETDSLTGAKAEDGEEALDEPGDDSLLTTRDNTSMSKDMEEQVSEEDNANSRTNSDIWSEIEDVVCEVIEDEESEQSVREASPEADVEEDGEAEEEDLMNKTEVLSLEPNVEKPSEEERNELNQEAQHQNIEDPVSEETEKEKEDADRAESRTQPSADKQPVILSNIRDSKEGSNPANGSGSPGSVGRKLVVSKQPKVYQVKAVPVVPPKPQHCKITALTLRQQQQERERRDNALKERDGDGDGETAEKKDRPSMFREKRRDGLDAAVRDAKRNSPLSMCFDEAVAIATLRREKERGREGEADPEGLGK